MQSDHVKLLDAGMGKTLSLKGVKIPPTIWSANALLVAPEIVVEIHKENIGAPHVDYNGVAVGVLLVVVVLAC